MLEINRNMSCASCMHNFDLCQHIASYLTGCTELLLVQLVSKIWQRSAQLHFELLKRSLDYRYLTFRSNYLYRSAQRICCKINNNRTSFTAPSATIDDGQQPPRLRVSRGFLLIGGSSVLNGESCWMQENPMGLYVGEYSSSNGLPHPINSTAAVIDSVSRNVVVMGGWKEDTGEATDEVYELDLSTTGWIKRSPIQRARCYSAAQCNVQGDILLFGGGSSPYRQADVYSDCMIRPFDRDEWLESVIPPMSQVRCGHAAVTLLSDQVLVAGGYSGGFDYMCSAEMLDRNLDRWVALPPMQRSRSGMAAVLSPFGSVYIAGGSIDGMVGLSSVERFDPREGRWEYVASMNHCRGYTSGDIGTWQSFFVSGGFHNNLHQRSVESYDFRADRWTNYSFEQNMCQVHYGSDYRRFRHLDRIDHSFSSEQSASPGEIIDDFILARGCHQMLYIW